MSIVAEKIEDEYVKRWFKNSFSFIFNNPLLIFYYLLTVTGWGFLLYMTPLKHALNLMFLFSGIYFIFLMYSLQYEASYKKVSLSVYLSTVKNTFKEALFYVASNTSDILIKLILIIGLVGFFDYSREVREYPIVAGERKIFYEDIVQMAILTCAWCVVLLESVLGRNIIGKLNKIPFSCEFILLKFSSFSKEEGVKTAINNLLSEANKINEKPFSVLNIFTYVFLFFVILFAGIHPIINLFIFAFTPIFFFQAGKETFLDQGNRKHQEQKQEEKQADVVPDASGA